MIVARQEYTVASGKADEALAWLREVRDWESYRLVYPRGCRVSAMSVGRLNKVVVEAEYASLQEYLACLQSATHQREYVAWRRRQSDLCLHVYGGYTHPNSAADRLELASALG